MDFNSVNPYNGQLIATHTEHTDEEISNILKNAHIEFLHWRAINIDKRASLLRNASKVLLSNRQEYAKMISLEMGKPIREAEAEVKKCATVCDYYADSAATFLEDEHIKTDASQSFVRHEPIGTVLAIMPWNFPFWQVFRFAAPTIMAGNTALLKHAPNVFGCAKLIEEVFREAEFPDHVFQNLIIHHSKTEAVIAHEAVKAISLTGSELAGSAVAAIAGKYIKKSLLELGGNNAFIVWADADIDLAVKTAITARMANCGQSCIAAKRFILMESIYDEFTSKFTEAVRLLKAGDPLDSGTQIGTLARKDLAENLHRQLTESVAMGAELLLGGGQNECFHEPSILGHVKPGMPAFDEETFGPLASMIVASNEDEGFELAEMSLYGLGVTVCTTDIERAINCAHKVSDGAYFVNDLVKSDPRLPFGGQKHSGFGRELAEDGIMEFVNRKTVFVK